MKNKKIGVVIILLSLISFTLDKFKIIFNFTLFDILAALLGIFLIIFSIINLWFFKKKNYFQINIVLIFFIKNSDFQKVYLTFEKYNFSKCLFFV